MPHQQGSIIAVERVGDSTLLISVSDDTTIILTLDQLVSLGVPRFTLAGEDERERSFCEPFDLARRKRAIRP